MIDFHQRLTELSQRSKTKTCWKIRYRGEYLRMSSGKESWTKNSVDISLADTVDNSINEYEY